MESEADRQLEEVSEKKRKSRWIIIAAFICAVIFLYFANIYLIP